VFVIYGDTPTLPKREIDYARLAFSCTGVTKYVGELMPRSFTHGVWSMWKNVRSGLSMSSVRPPGPTMPYPGVLSKGQSTALLAGNRPPILAIGENFARFHLCRQRLSKAKTCFACTARPSPPVEFSTLQPVGAAGQDLESNLLELLCPIIGKGRIPRLPKARGSAQSIACPQLWTTILHSGRRYSGRRANYLG